MDRSPGAFSVLLSLARFDFALFRPESMATERRSLVTCVLKSSTASLAEITRLDYLPQLCKSKMWGDELIIRGAQLFSDFFFFFFANATRYVGAHPLLFSHTGPKSLPRLNRRHNSEPCWSHTIWDPDWEI